MSGEQRAPSGATPASLAAIRSAKAELRKAVLARRDALPAEARRALSARITERVLALEVFGVARRVLAYMSFGSEFDTGAFVAAALARGKKLVLPRLERGAEALRLHVVRDPVRDLAAGLWGIREPRPERCPEADAAEIDFVLVPGLAFTPRCERLGYGRGYYDRLIRSLPRRPALVAAAFSLQIVPELPLTEADESLDLVVTEDAAYAKGSGPFCAEGS